MIASSSPLHRARRAGGVVLAGGAVVLAAIVLVPALLGFQRYVITSGSMTGTYDRGSIVYDRVVPTRPLDVGDVITHPPRPLPRRRRRHHVRPARGRRPGRPRHAPHRGDHAAARRRARVPHEGRREPGQGPVDVHADAPDAGARRLPPTLRRLRPRGARRAQGAHGVDRRAGAARRAVGARRPLARGGGGRRGGAPGMRRAVLALCALAALAVGGHGVRSSQAAFTATDHFTASMATASDWVAPAVTLTTPADGSYSKTTSVPVSGAAGNATGDATTVTLNVYSGTAATGTPVLTRAVTRSAAAWSPSVTPPGGGTHH